MRSHDVVAGGLADAGDGAIEAWDLAVGQGGGRDPLAGVDLHANVVALASSA